MSTSFDRYNTHLNILHEALELIDVGKLADECPHEWYNQTLCKVNDSVVRLGVVHGEYHRHCRTGEKRIPRRAEPSASSRILTRRPFWPPEGDLGVRYPGA